MKTQGTVQIRSPRIDRSAGRRWLAGVGLVLLVSFISLSAAACVQSGSQSGSQDAPNSPPGKWVQVLQGYTLTALAAAPNDPAIIYACAILPQQSKQAPPRSGPGHYTLLHSTDFGAHWQDIGSKIVLDGSCAFAINPTDSNDIYVVGPSSILKGPAVLQHSTDGGQTWNSILPTLQVPGLPYVLAWHVLQLSFEGDRLFGVQSVPQSIVFTPGQPILPARNFSSRRLVTSVDGGHNWTVVDGNISATIQGMSSYAVDPTNPDTIYEVVGTPLLPAQSQLAPQSSDAAITPHASLEGELYKTINSGSTWQLLLRGLPFGVQVSVASNKPNLVYLGGLIGPLPYVLRLQEVTSSVGIFYLSVSNDGGANWRQVGLPPQVAKLQNWSVGPGGDVYAATYLMPAATVVPAPIANATPTPSIQRYDPAANAWSEVTEAPSPGSLLSVTSPGAGSGAVLWFIGTSNGSEILYRDVV